MNKEDVYNKIANKWKEQRGNGSVYAIDPVNAYEFAIHIVRLMRNKNSNCRVFVLCNNYSNYDTARHYFNQAGLLDSVTIVSTKYLNPIYQYKYNVCIAIGFSVLLDRDINIIEQSTFRLVLLDKRIKEQNINDKINSHFPIIDNVISNKEAHEIRSNSPVEEYRIDVTFDDEDEAKYKEYDEYIVQSMQIFGNLDTMDKCRIGDRELNISRQSMCDYIARNNGWSEYLDTTIAFNAEIDKIYNPLSIGDRADRTYNIMRLRSQLVANNKNKLSVIKDIVEKYDNRRIIIVSKQGEFAHSITKYLQEHDIACGEYHDCVPAMNAVDANGNPVLVKSGVNKGKPRVLKAQAVSNEYLRRFRECGNFPYDPNFNRVQTIVNMGGINVLSIKNASSDELECTSDVFIFTSAMYADWWEFKYRFNKVRCGESPIRLYKLYTIGTIEEKAFDKVKASGNYKIMTDEKIATYDENIGAVVL